MKFTIENRYTGKPQFECELPEYFEGEPYSFQLGEAVKIAIKEGTDLERANLRGADLTSAKLMGTNLAGANLRGGNLRCTDLAGADLAGADLEGVKLIGTNLMGADLIGAKLDYKIQEGLLEQIAEIAIENPNKLERGSLAGWACHLNNTARELEKSNGTQIAGLLTLGAEAHSYFLNSKEENLEWLKTKLGE